MSLVSNCIKTRNKDNNPIWIMRQAGRYLPEFRKIREKNPDFINLCLNKELVKEITLQPIKRFNLDAAIIFSDILMVPFGLNQTVEFKKNYGPILGDFVLDKTLKVEENDFECSLSPVYKAMKNISKDKSLGNKDIIGFVGAPWTLLVYILNKSSPKNGIDHKIIEDEKYINQILNILIKFLKLHIKNQINNGATVIQIFDSWAGLVEDKGLENLVYSPTHELTKYIKTFNVPVICFPRNIKNYRNFVANVKPDAVNIDYSVNPDEIADKIDIPIQGGMDPKILLTDRENLKKEAEKYLNVFKDHPYIFNLGHGILPETKIEMVEELIKIVRDFK